MMTHGEARRWPPIPYEAWRETCSALHLWTQIAGKYRFAHTPWVNHSWHATLYVTPRGLTTGTVPDPAGAVSLDFDLVDHRLVATLQGGPVASFPLEAMSVADFYARTRRALEAVGATATLHARPSEVPDAVPFPEDTRPRPYDAEAVARFHRALVHAHRVLSHFRTSFVGKVSPVHLFWGAFDLAVTRFSGRRAPRHPGGFPNLPDAVPQEAYSHEVSSAGFWPGGGGVDDAAFYAYAYPEPEGYRAWEIAPEGASYHEGLREFVLPYETVRTAADPDGMLMAFLRSTYEGAATLAGWDRAALECELGRPGVPRSRPAPLDP